MVLELGRLAVKDASFQVHKDDLIVLDLRRLSLAYSAAQSVFIGPI